LERVGTVFRGEKKARLRFDRDAQTFEGTGQRKKIEKLFQLVKGSRMRGHMRA